MTSLQNFSVNPRVKISALWSTVMFCYVYGDYFGLYAPGKITAMIGGAGPFGRTTQATLLSVSVMMALPALMVSATLVLPPLLTRWLNITLGLAYTAIVALTLLPGGSWPFYIFFSAVEMLFTLTIVWFAWKWPSARVNQ